jgi:hypothetical protein
VRQAGHSLGLKRRRSDQAPEKRPRQLARPEQVADVRKSGACLPCRVSKTRVRQPTLMLLFPNQEAKTVSVSRAWRLPHVQKSLPEAFPPGLYSYEPC